MTPADMIYYFISDFEKKPNPALLMAFGPSCVSDLQAQKLSLAHTASSSSAKTHSVLKASKFNPYCCLERTCLSKQPSLCLNSAGVGQQ